MKKAVFIALLLSAFAVYTSQAVVIGWKAEGMNFNGGYTVGYARLIYVADGSQPELDGSGNWSAGVEMVSAYASGGAIYNSGSKLYPQQATDGTTRSAGAYYVVLFDNAFENYSVSTTALDYNDAMISIDPEFDPVTTYFTPTTFSAWGVIPEPSTATLLVIGAAVAALRRRKRA